MTLDDELRPSQELSSLVVGNVEHAIGEIAEHSNGISRAKDEAQIELETYKAVLEEKLPRIIGNISLMGRQICGAKGKLKVNAGSEKFGSDYYSPFLDLGDRKLCLRTKLFGDEIHFEFNEDYRLERISLYEVFDGPRGSTQFQKRGSSGTTEEQGIGKLEKYIPTFMKPIAYLRGKQEQHPNLTQVIQDFCDWYIPMAVHGKSKYADYVHILNRVPEYMAQVYKEIEKNLEEERNFVAFKRKSIEGLDVSDFSP